MSRLRWSALVLTLILLAACGGSRPTSTPDLLGALPAPPTLPPPETATPALPSPTPWPTATPTPTPLPPTPTPTPTPTVLSPLLLPGGYVVTGASLFTAPSGDVLAVLPAGVRVGLLGRSADGAWFQALYQPDPGQSPLRGWVRAGAVTVFADPDRLTVVAAAPSAEAGTPSGEETAVVLADRLNLREGPGLDRAVVGVLRRGERVTVLVRSADGAWLRVRTAAGQEGWVAAAFVGRESGAAGETTRPIRRSLLVQPRLGGDFYVLSWPDGALRRLSTGLDPVLSPDGRRVAFTRWEEPRGLWVIGSDGRDERLVFGANRARLPTWSPDGHAVVLEIGLDSRRCHQTPFGCLTAAEWQARFGAECVPTPFGRLCLGDFALVTLEETTLVRVNLDDGSIRHLPVGNRAQAPSYHPRREEVVFLDENGLAVVNPLADDPPRRLIERPGGIGPAVYSADGESLYAAVRAGDHWDIWRWRADGSGGVALTAPPALRREPIHSLAPALGPDGRTILFLSNRRGRWEVWQMNPDGSNQQPLTVPGLDFTCEFANERPVGRGP